VDKSAAGNLVVEVPVAGILAAAAVRVEQDGPAASPEMC